jgi:hypothetical protein
MVFDAMINIATARWEVKQNNGDVTQTARLSKQRFEHYLGFPLDFRGFS